MIMAPLRTLLTLTVPVLVTYACATAGVEEPDSESMDAAADTRVAPKTPDAGRADSGRQPTPDGGTPLPDSGADAKADVASGPPATGSACAVENEIFKKPCGACGTAEAVCEVPSGGGALAVSSYGACYGELAGGCVPGSTTASACGLCGTQTSICQNNCRWVVGTCAGEPAFACAPGSQTYTSAGCPTLYTYRTRTCGATCTYTALSPTCAEPVNANKVALGSAAGDVASLDLALDATHMARTVTSTACGTAAALSTTTNYPFVDVEVGNPNAQPAEITVYNSATTGTPTYLDTTLRVYASPLPPQDDAELKACSYGIGDYCATGVPCGGSYLASLTGVVVPAGGKVLVRVATKYTSASTSYSIGPVKLNAQLVRLL
jgi:hypothetical protein